MAEKPVEIVSVDNKELQDEIQLRIDRLELLRMKLESGNLSLTVKPADGHPANTEHNEANTLAKVEAAIARLTEAREAVRATCGWQGLFCLFEVE
ncbi:MAG: hypothetical protein Q8T13_02520 [Acidobacteriota bacterium]|nr:hypothetical protein [Acidobacteriota bacterium]